MENKEVEITRSFEGEKTLEEVIKELIELELWK